MDRIRLALTSTLALALAAGIVSASMQLQTAAGTSSNQPVVDGATPLSLGWAPDWLAKPLSRALADATDPRERDKETGLPKAATKGGTPKGGAAKGTPKN